MNKLKTENRQNNIHAGHRQRLKEKATNIGLKNFNEHEALELMLTYAIPRYNTNPTAHALLNEFGSLYNICNASVHELEHVPGVGKECAKYLTFLLEFSEMMLKSKNTKVEYLGSTNRAVLYFRNNYRVTENEACYIVCLNSRNKIIKTLEFGNKDEIKVMFDFREVIKQLIAIKAYGIVVMHTHPNGEAKPSEQDLIATFQIVKQCMMANIKVFNHLIFNETSYCSLEDEIIKFTNYLNKNYKDMLAGDSQTLAQVLKQEN